MSYYGTDNGDRISVSTPRGISITNQYSSQYFPDIDTTNGITIDGRGGNDFILGGGGNDSLYGGDGSDTLIGSIGNDSLYGGNGDDVLTGGNGNDVLTGGNGKDIFYLATEGSYRETDRVLDFTPGADKIKLNYSLGFDDVTISRISNTSVGISLAGDSSLLIGIISLPSGYSLTSVDFDFT